MLRIDEKHKGEYYVPNVCGTVASKTVLDFFWPPAIAQATAIAGDARRLAPLRKAEWMVYAKKPFGGPQAVLAYLSRYTHRVAISNRRLISADETGFQNLT